MGHPLGEPLVGAKRLVAHSDLLAPAANTVPTLWPAQRRQPGPVRDSELWFAEWLAGRSLHADIVVLDQLVRALRHGADEDIKCGAHHSNSAVDATIAAYIDSPATPTQGLPLAKTADDILASTRTVLWPHPNGAIPMRTATSGSRHECHLTSKSSRSKEGGHNSFSFGRYRDARPLSCTRTSLEVG